MIAVQYPYPQFKIKKSGSCEYIFDVVRKGWRVLTAEEWVRQNFIAYLTQVMLYPQACVAVEKEISFNGLRKRFDILVYDSTHQPWLLVECKEPSVALNDAILQQALRYNLSVPVSFIVITNGGHTLAWQKKDAELIMLNALPAWVKNDNRIN